MPVDQREAMRQARVAIEMLEDVQREILAANYGKARLRLVDVSLILLRLCAETLSRENEDQADSP